MIWTEGPEKLKIFVDYLNNLHSTIKFTCSHSPTNILLDVMVSIKDGFIEADLYTKPTDKHQYLLISSCHPQHTKRSIPYSLALRLRRICSIPFVITYNPALPNIARIIHQHSNVLYSSDPCRNVFKTLPLVAYRRCKNISDILVRAQLTETPDSSNSRATPGSFRCNSRNCTTCPYIEHGRNHYTFHSTGETYHIKSHITCTTFNVIYMIQCRLCNLQYIGETKRRLKDRFNEHRRPVLNPTSNYISTAVSEHSSQQ